MLPLAPITLQKASSTNAESTGTKMSEFEEDSRDPYYHPYRQTGSGLGPKALSVTKSLPNFLFPLTEFQESGEGPTPSP